MNINIQQLIEKGEGISVEFKKAENKLPETLFETICAFLNRNGGVILPGIDDDKSLIGIDPDKAEMMCKSIANLSNNPQKLFPSFLLESQIIDYQDKLLIHVFVPESSQVYTCNGKVFDRSADGDFELRASEQIKNLYSRKNAFYSENTIYPFLFETDFVPGLLERARKLIKINRPDHPWNELSDDDFFRTAGLFRRDLATGSEGFTMAALLLFGKDEVIQSAIPHYKIDALVRRVDIARYDDRENIRCNIIEAYDKLTSSRNICLINSISMAISEFRYVKKYSARSWPICLSTANITNAYPASFIIFNNRLETKNANRPHLYGQLLPDTFEPFPKNPHLAQLFTQIGRSEELGTGLRNVFKYSKAYSGSDKIIVLEEDIFQVTVPLSEEVTDNVTKDVTKDVTKENRGIKIFDLMKSKPGITVDEIASHLELTRRTILRGIDNLKKQNKVERIGGRKNGYWAVK